MKSSYRVIVRLPLGLLLFYIAITLAAFYLGPFDFPVPHWPALFAFIALAIGSIIAGYYLSILGKPAGSPLQLWRLIFIIGAVSSCLILFPSVYVYTGKMPWDIVTAFCDQNEAYLDLQSRLATISQMARAPVIVARALTYPFVFAVIPLGIFYWRELSWPLRVLMFVSVLATVTFSIFRGTDRELFDLLLVAGAALLAVTCRSFLDRGFRATVLSRGTVVVALAGIVFMGSALLLFAERKTQRITSTTAVAGADVGCWDQGFLAQSYGDPIVEDEDTEADGKGLEGSRVGGDRDRRDPASRRQRPPPFALCVGGDDPICADYSGPVMQALGRYGGVAALMSAYLGQGYYGLSLALNKDFRSTLGVGHSPVLTRIYEIGTGDTSLYRQSYTYRLRADGWSDAHQWSTIFTWLANDVGFLGSALLVGGFAFLWGMAWKDAVFADNARAIVVFAFLSQLFLYLPANNQLALSLDAYFGLTVWLIIWLAERFGLLNRLGLLKGTRGQQPPA